MKNIKLIAPLLGLFMISAFGCQKVDKPARGEEDSSPMAIVIDGDAPDSHITSKTSEGTTLVNPYSNTPIVGKLFRTSLTGLEFWKAYHPVLVSGTNDPQLIVATEDEEELCLDCHDQNTSCNSCHNYVGVALITTSEE